MKTPARIVIILVVAAAAAAAVFLKDKKTSAISGSSESAVSASSVTPAGEAAATPVDDRLPKLLDLGAGKCIPCKKMAPILEELKKEYAGRIEVEFIDVWKNPGAGKAYGVEMIPTQIFYDANGQELDRHTGFLGREDILAKWKELGVDLTAAEKQ